MVSIDSSSKSTAFIFFLLHKTLQSFTTENKRHLLNLPLAVLHHLFSPSPLGLFWVTVKTLPQPVWTADSPATFPSPESYDTVLFPHTIIPVSLPQSTCHPSRPTLPYSMIPFLIVSGRNAFFRISKGFWMLHTYNISWRHGIKTQWQLLTNCMPKSGKRTEGCYLDTLRLRDALSAGLAAEVHWGGFNYTCKCSFSWWH